LTATATTGLPAGYAARPPVPDDAEAVAAIMRACQADEGSDVEATAEDVASDWSTTANLADEALVVTDDKGEIVAEVDLLNRQYKQVYVYGYVHPNHRGRGIGRYLAEWAEDWAREHSDRAPDDAQINVRFYVNAKNQSGRALLEKMAYPAVRGVYVMKVDLDEERPAPEWPTGIEARPLVLGRDEAAAHQVVEDSFRDHWGRTPNTLENFKRFTAKESFAAWASFLAYEGEGAVGVITAETGGESGWVATVGVRREARRRGLALALLRQAFRCFYKRGFRRAQLSVDSESPTNAPALYRRAGMEVKENFVVFQKAIRDGRDYTTAGDTN
jgi:mycothiol synthase